KSSRIPCERSTRICPSSLVLCQLSVVFDDSSGRSHPGALFPSASFGGKKLFELAGAFSTSSDAQRTKTKDKGRRTNDELAHASLRVTADKSAYDVVVGRGAWRALRRFPVAR